MSRKVLLFSVVLAMASTARAQDVAPTAPVAGTGSLQRVAATLESTLDIYRLALMELAPAAKKIHEAGLAPGASPESPLPYQTTEVFKRLAASVVRRVAKEALPAVARAYHAEVVDALEALSRADTLGDVLEPYQALVVALERLAGEADEIVDLFSRRRPLETQIVDSDGVLDDITEALDELSTAEAGITRAQKKGTMGEQLQAFLRLEIALGHALDLIAAAQEAGIHIGFEVQLSTANFQKVLLAVRSRLGELHRTLAQLEKAPVTLETSLVAQVVMGEESGVRLSWLPPQGEAQPAAVRVYKRWPKEAMVAHVRDELVCYGGTPVAAEERARERLVHVQDAWVKVTELAPGRGSFGEELALDFVMPPEYKVVPVSAFGVEGTGAMGKTLWLPPAPEAAPLVQAELAVTDPAMPTFYREYDVVRLRFSPSRSELPAASAQLNEGTMRAWAQEQKLPFIKSYRVLRVSGGNRVTEVTQVAPGTHEAVDRPSADELKAGIAYYVETITDVGRAGQNAPGPCKTSELQWDPTKPIELARLGMASVQHPTKLEQAELTRLQNSGALAEALTAFEKRPAEEQRALLRAWWLSMSEAERVSLLGAWPRMVAKESKDAWLREAYASLRERDEPWVATELWLLAQPPFVQREVERFWGLLDQTSQTRARTAFVSRANAELMPVLRERLAKDDMSVLRAVKVLAWYDSKDPSERERLHEAYTGMAEDLRADYFAEWFGDQPEELKLLVRWPDLARLTKAERAGLLENGYRELPLGAWPFFFAWQKWHELDATALAQVLNDEVGGGQQALLNVRWIFRPLDRALGFRLPLLLVVLSLLGSGCGWWVLSRRRKMPRIRT